MDAGSHDLDSQIAPLRRLARRLLYDRSRADDVVQEAWLRALRQPGGLASVSPGWLAGVVRNLALQTRREERRRSRREAVAARAESVAADAASGGPGLEQLEVLQGVLRALGELDEPYRSTLLARFIEGQKPGHIATAQGVPARTVYTRIQRGLKQLRARLEDRNPGGRASLLGGLVAFAGPPPWTWAVGIPTVSSWPTGGAWIMGAKSWVGIVGVLVGLGVWFAVSGDGEMVQPLERSGEAEQQQPLQTVAEAEAETEPAVAVARRAAPGAVRDWVVRGKTLRRDGSAAGRVELALSFFEGWNLGVPAALEATTVSDAQGNFSFELAPSQGAVSLRVEPRSPTYFGFHEERKVRSGGPPPQDLELRLYALDSVVRGQVRGPKGPIKGAEVWAGERRTRTDGQGRYELRASSESERTYVFARAAGHASQRAAAARPTSGTAQLDFELSYGRRVHGVVRDAGGTPVGGARVFAFPLFSDVSETDESGHYELLGVDPGSDFLSLVAECDGFVDGGGLVEGSGRDDAELDIVLDRGLTITGTVLDGDGAPVFEAAVYPVRGWELTGLTDVDGRFEIATVRRDTQLFVKAPGFAPQFVDVPQKEDSERVEDLRVVLGAGVAVSGHVVDAQGAPLPGVRVGTYMNDEYLSASDETDAEGAFEISDLPAGELQLTFSKQGYDHRREPITVPASSLSFAMQRKGRLRGIVLDAETDAPIESFNVRFMGRILPDGRQSFGGFYDPWGREGVSFSEPTGEWETGNLNLVAGDVVIFEVSADGYPPRRMEVEVPGDADAEPVVARLGEGASVRGSVVLAATEKPVARVHVRLLDRTMRWSASTRDRVETWTDEEGQFELGPLPAGEATLVLTHEDFPEWHDASFDVPGSGVVERHIRIAGRGIARGQVLDASGAPLAGQKVLARAVDVPGEQWEAYTTTTDEHGEFAFGELLPGTYYFGHALLLEIEAIGCASFVELPAGGEAWVELRPSGSASVRGRLASTESLPEAMSVMLMPASFPGGAAPSASEVERLRGAVARDGEFAVPAIEPGAYRIEVRHRDRDRNLILEGVLEVQLDAGQAADVELTLSAREP